MTDLPMLESGLCCKGTRFKGFAANTIRYESEKAANRRSFLLALDQGLIPRRSALFNRRKTSYSPEEGNKFDVENKGTKRCEKMKRDKSI